MPEKIKCNYCLHEKVCSDRIDLLNGTYGYMRIKFDPDKCNNYVPNEDFKRTNADVRPERHGHIIWRKRHRGGFRTAKCLSDFGNCIFTPTCKRIAKIDERCIIDEPYCSECSKLLGDFLNFCPNCGAKMDGKDDKNA